MAVMEADRPRRRASQDDAAAPLTKEQPKAAPADGAKSCVARLAAIFGSRKALAAALGVRQNTISTWDARGVPYGRAPAIQAAAARAGRDLSLETLFAWMEADDKRRAA